jgi:hypothetical protein
MTLKARVVNTEASAAKAIAGTMAMAVRAATLVASVERALVVREAVSAATFARKVAKIARAAILEASAAKALVDLEVAVISAADLAAAAVFKEVALPAKAVLVQDLVNPATGIGNPVQLTIKKMISFTGFTR